MLAFANSKTNEVLQIVQIDKSCMYHHANTCQYDPSLLVEWWKQNNVEEVRVKKTRSISMRSMFMHFLLCLNQDFDDDLLQDALKLLGYE